MHSNLCYAIRRVLGTNLDNFTFYKQENGGSQGIIIDLDMARTIIPTVGTGEPVSTGSAPQPQMDEPRSVPRN